ncbi:hypothetical protein CQA66_07675 [Helicobacter aurati]|uniref:Urease accessory protein UreH-like transmembrane domain-containing protein n=1 Tax=Helicobacter aurati TaxID=137778 RepID=A0A3D8IZM0_9HELI|nr:sulfite exporter TauE/SafE family protein [Helicobacter aurati]RDU70709.1 hypothetical protein CQA66_07675 [Helicobacter aurati]
MTIQDSLLIVGAAFTGSLAHCTGMCGGIVLSLNMKERIDSKLKQILANLLYFFGRLCGYCFVGIAFTLLGMNFSRNHVLNGIIFIVLGVLLFISATIFTFFPKGFKVFTQASKPDSKIHSRYKFSLIRLCVQAIESLQALLTFFYKKTFGIAFRSEKFIRFFVIGILNGLLPCGLVYMFALQAAQTMSVMKAMFVMLLFGLGTFLPLFLMGILSLGLLSSRMRSFFLRLCFVIMVYFSGQSIYHGYMQITANASDSSHLHHHHH